MTVEEASAHTAEFAADCEADRLYRGKHRHDHSGDLSPWAIGAALGFGGWFTSCSHAAAEVTA